METRSHSQVETRCCPRSITRTVQPKRARRVIAVAAGRQNMSETERRAGEQGGAYIGGRWVSADELRARGRRVTDALARAAEGRDDVGRCRNCGSPVPAPWMDLEEVCSYWVRSVQLVDTSRQWIKTAGRVSGARSGHPTDHWNIHAAGGWRRTCGGSYTPDADELCPGP